jgi:hypothetical protein
MGRLDADRLKEGNPKKKTRKREEKEDHKVRAASRARQEGGIKP